MKTDTPISAKDGALAARVLRTFSENVTHRRQSGADGVLSSALSAWARVPPEEDIALFKSMGVLPSTYDSLTRVKLVQIMAVLNRVFGQIGDKSWALSPTPDPVLPTDVDAAIVMKYAMEGIQLAQASGATDENALNTFISASLSANEKQIYKDRMTFAQERCERMERKVDDVLLEAEVSVTVIRRFITNLTKLGTAIIVGPCEEPVVTLKLQGKGDTVRYVPVVDMALRYTVPSTMNIYPSPGALEADDADLCIKVQYNKAALARAASSKTSGAWRVDAIKEVLASLPGVDISSQTLTDPLVRAAQLEGPPGTTRLYEGVRWFGLASGEELRELGIETDGIGDINPDSYYEAEAVVVANRVIYAKVCDPAVRRPVVKTTFYGDAAQFFGFPPALQIDNCQKLMNLAMAALKKQLQLSGLVPLVVNGASDFVDADRPGAFALTPGKVYLRNINAFNQQGQGAPIQPIVLPQIIRELIALFDAISRLCDDASGFNRNMLGSGNFAGAARTATGLMQIQEAASIIATFVIGNIDATGIVPLLNKTVAWLNHNHPDKRIKGDAQIVARGQLSKVMKSAQQQVITAGFQATQGGVMPQLLGPEKLLVAFREYMKSIDFPNADKLIPDEERVAFLAAMADAERAMAMTAQQQQGGAQGGAGEGQPQSGTQPNQAQPQQAQKQAGLGMPSAVEERRSVA